MWGIPKLTGPRQLSKTLKGKKNHYENRVKYLRPNIDNTKNLVALPKPLQCRVDLGLRWSIWAYLSLFPKYLSELDFSNSSVWNIVFDELDFFPVWNQLAIFLVQNDFHGQGEIFWWTLLNYLLPFYNLQRYTLPVSGLVDSLQPLLWIKKIKTLENPSLFTLIWHF